MPAEQGKPKLERKTYRESATMFEEMASGMSRNRYPRSGPASTILAWPMLLQPLPQKRIFPRVAPAFIGSGADSACKKKPLSLGRERENAESSTAPSAALENRQPGASPAPKQNSTRWANNRALS